MYPELTADDEIFFEVGSQGALFEGYDGQPVLIWTTDEEASFLKELGESETSTTFSIRPQRARNERKYSSVKID